MDADQSFLQLAVSSDRETAAVEFKSAFDVHSNREWCELLKDVVAIANSGGGVIVIGLDDHGAPSNIDIAHSLT